MKSISCKQCWGDVPIHWPATRKCSGLRGETSMNGGPQLMTLWQATLCDKPRAVQEEHLPVSIKMTSHNYTIIELFDKSKLQHT